MEASKQREAHGSQPSPGSCREIPHLPSLHDAANGARFLQVRFTFVNNTAIGLSPELDSFGVAYERGL